MILEARFLSWKKYLCEVLQMTLLFLFRLNSVVFSVINDKMKVDIQNII